MYYTVYKITNLINDKIYIGVHKTKDINDDYMGSGKILKRAQEKYGIEKFKKEILEVFDNADDMFNMESKLVNEDFVKDKNNYNLKPGGEGGWYLTKEQLQLGRKKANENGACEKAQEALVILRKDKDWVNGVSTKRNITLMEKYGTTKTKGSLGTKHTEETKKRIGEANSKHQSGTGNSQFGTMWIHNLEEKLSKKIKKEELPEFKNKGWLKGRKMKF